MEKYTVKEETSLIEALSSFYPDSSKRTLEHWIKGGRVLLDDDRVEKKALKVAAGQILTLVPKPVRPPFRGIHYLYVDRFMIVIHKPPFLLSVASENPEEDNALEYLREDFQTDTIFPVHRLDRECSGTLVFARGKESQNRFDQMFEAHDLTREYIAILEGRLSQKTGTWTSFLVEEENYNVSTTTEDKGKVAITHFEVLRYSNLFTYIKLQLETGRKHQIRVHCKEAGHPIVGDLRYKSLANPVRRLCLHALRLTLQHPFTGKKLTFYSQPPRAFTSLGFPPV